MTVYGNFEAIKKVSSSHHGTLWSARTAGTAEPADCCIKVIQLNPTMVQEGDTALAKHLLIAAALQQAMGNKSEYWAPIYGLGSQGTNGFYVSKLYARSAQSFVDHNIRLTSSELKIILLDVLEGLMDLDAGFHRSHGNLKPSNVLIGDRSRIRKGAVFLTDPDASNEDVPSMTRTPDSKALGELIYALVTHKPHVTARWPLTKTPHWKRMGSTGRQWFTLCDDLLNTVSRRGLPTLERIRERVEAIHPTPRQVPRSVLALFALAGVAAAGYAERHQLPGWYQQANQKMAALVAAWKPGVPPASTQPIVPKPIADLTATTRSVVAPVSQAFVRPNPVSPVPRPIVVPPPVQPPIASTAKVDDEGTNIILGFPAPELHSAAAKREFVDRQKKFALKYAGYGTATALADWNVVLAKVLLLETTYPPLDPASTTGWPAGVANIMDVRRDAALVKMIDADFDRRHISGEPFQQSEARVAKAANAVVAARDSMARGDVLAAEKSIRAYHEALNSFPDSDADLRELFSSVDREFAPLTQINAGADRAELSAIADNESAALAVRVAAFFRLDSVNTDPWPGSFAALAADDARSIRLNTLLQETGSISAAGQVITVETGRRETFFSRLKDQAAVTAALHDSSGASTAGVLDKSPLWFRYDAALFTLKTTLPARVTDEEKKQYNDLAARVDAPGVQLVRDVLQESQSALPKSLAESGPASIKGWQLRAGWTRDRCTYVSPAGTDTLEFLHVHVLSDPDGIDCYLCTTEAPVAMLRHLLNGNLTAFNAAESLNASPVPPAPGMRIWNFDDATGSVDLDDSDYRRCFIVSPNEQLPLNFVTPQTAFYLSRRLGCRLPTSREWLAALSQARSTTETNMKGFATLGFRLRDRQFSKLLGNPNRDPNYWPDDNIFIVDSGREIVPRGAGASIWQASDLEALSGRNADAPGAALYPLSTLVASSGFGFRTVGDTDNFGSVFHDLIGNVAEFTMDAPVTMAEKVIVAPSQPSGETVRRVNDWFSSDHLKTVSVIGGSALSPPSEDPLKPYPLPGPSHPRVYADVGFRLAFTDPVCVPNAQRAVIGQASFLTAP